MNKPQKERNGLLKISSDNFLDKPKEATKLEHNSSPINESQQVVYKQMGTLAHWVHQSSWWLKDKEICLVVDKTSLLSEIPIFFATSECFMRTNSPHLSPSGPLNFPKPLIFTPPMGRDWINCARPQSLITTEPELTLLPMRRARFSSWLRGGECVLNCNSPNT